MKSWPTRPLLDVARLTRGTEPGSSTYTSARIGTRFLRVGDITGKTDNPVYTSATDLVMVQSKDILLALDGTPGHVSTGHVGAISSGIRRVEVLDNHVVTASWLRYALSSPEVQMTIKKHARGVTILHASSCVPHIKVSVPPLEEQERLIGLLRKAEELCSLRADASRRGTAIAPALFSEMFGDPSSNPKGWDATTISELGTVVTGNTPPRSDPSFYGDFIEWVKTDNIDPERGIVGVASERLSVKGADRGRIVPAGSVLITCIAGSIAHVGDAAVTDREVAINQQINAIVPKKAVESAFLVALVCALKPLIQARATGVMTRIINKSGLEGIPAFAPPLSLQRKFATRIAEIRNVERDQEVSRQRLDSLFESLLYRAFAGEL